MPVPGEAVDEAPLTIGVSALMSYEHTGAVRLSCEHGCSCKPRCREALVSRTPCNNATRHPAHVMTATFHAAVDMPSTPLALCESLLHAGLRHTRHA